MIVHVVCLNNSNTYDYPFMLWGQFLILEYVIVQTIGDGVVVNVKHCLNE